MANQVTTWLLEDADVERIEQLAKAESRTISAMVALLIVAGLEIRKEVPTKATTALS